MFENTYWNNDGKYQSLYTKLYEQVPPEGKADKVHIDLLRNVSNLYYDLYNNGFGNCDVLHLQWEHLAYHSFEIISEEIDSVEFGKAERIVDDWMHASESDAYIWDDEEDFYEPVPDFEELEKRGFCELMEKLTNAVVIYAAKKEGLM
jgi:hypothetical protein